MTNEENIKQELIQKFPFLAEKFLIARPRRIFVDVAQDQFQSVLTYVASTMHFPFLCTITGLDEGENLTFLYHLDKGDGTLLTINTKVPKSNPVIHSVTHLYAGAASYERELVDLLGAIVQGIPPGKRYPLPDGWPEGQHPLRKDWKLEMLTKASKGE